MLHEGIFTHSTVAVAIAIAVVDPDPDPDVCCDPIPTVAEPDAWTGAGPCPLSTVDIDLSQRSAPECMPFEMHLSVSRA